MSAAMKQAARKKQGGTCAISGRALPDETPLYDVHRPIPKAKGGKLKPSNLEAVDPVAHQVKHETFRQLSPELTRIREIIDNREQLIATRIGINNRLLAHRRRVDILGETTKVQLQFFVDEIDALVNLASQDLSREIKRYARGDSFTAITLEVPYVGPVTAAYCAVYLDLTRARHASSLWRYVGLDRASHERYVKGEAGGGNKRLRTVLWNMANSQVKGKKNGAPYAYLADREKMRLSLSEKLVQSRNTKGQLVTIPWKETMPCHRHGHALRIIIKHFLADYWYVGRMFLGLPTDTIYAESKLEGNHRTIMPQERGWKF